MFSDILDDVEYDPLWILNILQVCPLLQKLSVMVSKHGINTCFTFFF
jgi:hypothetical protein